MKNLMTLAIALFALAFTTQAQNVVTKTSEEVTYQVNPEKTDTVYQYPSRLMIDFKDSVAFVSILTMVRNASNTEFVVIDGSLQSRNLVPLYSNPSIKALLDQLRFLMISMNINENNSSSRYGNNTWSGDVLRLPVDDRISFD